MARNITSARPVAKKAFDKNPEKYVEKETPRG